jgi:FKBP-type peptidyl-prolyl cis-trans isomerase
MKNVRYIAAACAALLIAGTSCSKKALDTVYSSQEKNIASLVSTLSGSDSTAKVEQLDGVTRITVVQGEGAALEGKGKATVLYAGHYINSSSLNVSNLFFTNNASYADRLKWSVTDTTVFQPLTVDLQQGDLLEGLRKGLPGVRAGHECYLLFTGRYGLGKGRMGTVPVHAALAYHLWVQSVDNTQ